MQIKKNTIVTMHYTLKNEMGEVIDSSEGKDPMKFLQGSHAIIKGLESALEGHKAGDQFTVNVEPEDGYGIRHDSLIQQVSKTAFDQIPNLQIGMRLMAESDRGEVPVVVTEINDEYVVVDGNHELAGFRLIFDINVINVREATSEELEHGHAH